MLREKMSEEENGFVYILKNESMPGIYKIGVTGRNELDARIDELYIGKTNIPLPFECVFACRVKNYKDVEKIIHNAFMDTRINPNREFFTIDPERVIPLLKHLQIDDVTIDVKTKIDKQIDCNDIESIKNIIKKRPKFNFVEMGIPIGSKIIFYDPDNPAKAEVIGERIVKYNGNGYKLTALSSELLNIDYNVRPMHYWKYNGKLLREYYNETYNDIE
jgi:hypothetical protein